MSTEECVLVLQSTLNEIKNVCPQVSHAFIFNQGRDILAKDANTDETTANNTIEAFQAISNKVYVYDQESSYPVGLTEAEVICEGEAINAETARVHKIGGPEVEAEGKARQEETPRARPKARPRK